MSHVDSPNENPIATFEFYFKGIAKRIHPVRFLSRMPLKLSITVYRVEMHEFFLKVICHKPSGRVFKH